MNLEASQKKLGIGIKRQTLPVFSRFSRCLCHPAIFQQDEAQGWPDGLGSAVCFSFAFTMCYIIGFISVFDGVIQVFIVVSAESPGEVF